MMNSGLTFVMIGGAATSVVVFALLNMPRTDYWPADLLSGVVVCNGQRYPVLGDFRAHWYASHLEAAGEQPIFNRDFGSPGSTQRVVRFTWLRTFHKPVIIRIDTDSRGVSTLTATELTGAGGYEPGTVGRRVVRVLTRQERARLDNVLHETRVFEQAPLNCEGAGADGSQWIAEQADASGYRYVDRWTPRTGPSREFGLYLLSLTRWTFDEVY